MNKKDLMNRAACYLPVKLFIKFVVIALVFTQICTFRNAQAEGSVDYYPSGATGARASMRANVTVNTASSGAAAININGSNDSLIKVYAQPGEQINLGSSAIGTGGGDIYLMKPDGTFAGFNGGASTSCASLPGDTGIIENRTEELNGTGPGGYTPCTYMVAATEEGVFYVFYHESNNGGGPENLTANANWSKAAGHQDNDSWTTAWDVTVTLGGSPQPGRAYVNEFQGGIPNRNPWTVDYFVQTKDGIQYEVENVGLRGIYFGMFVNNKGSRDASGNPRYRSISEGSANTHNPESLDSGTDITQKVFFNPIDPILPETAASPRGDEWLYMLPAEVMTVTFTGIEGTPGTMGVGMGGIFTINATGAGLGYEINIDGNSDGDLNDPEDISLTGITTGSSTDVVWDGNGSSAFPEAGDITGIQILGKAGEVHFPFTDVEGSDGLIIKRLNGVGASAGSPDCTIFWDDTNFPRTRNGGSGISDDNNTRDGTAGLDSCSATATTNTCNGAPYNGLTNFDSKHFWCPDWGNRLFADTWTFAPPSRFDLTITAQEADLILSSKTVSNAAPNPGDNITFTVIAINNGPDDATDVLISDSLDTAYLSNVTFTSCVSTGGAVCGTPAVSGNDFSMLVPQMPDGGQITIELSADTASGNIAETSVTNIATILRNSDIYDPQATNADSTAPADTQSECEATQAKGAVTVGFPACNNASAVVFQLPVTLSSVASERTGDRVNIDWSTSSELFNAGFQLWGLDGYDSKWEKLHGWLIRSGSGNAVEPQSYRKTLRIPASVTELAAVGLSSIDSDGSEHYYGPFEVGAAYGNLGSLKPIAWDHIRDKVDAQMTSRGYVKDRINGYRKSRDTSTRNSIPANTETLIEFRVSEAGMYRITANDLLNAGIDWREKRSGDIALIDHRGNPVVRYVTARGAGSGWNRTLGTSGEIYFYAPDVDVTAGLYTNVSVYRLVTDPYRALQGQYQKKQGVGSGFSRHYMETARVEQDTHYVLTSAADDPWLDAVVLGYADQPGSYAVSVPVEADALWSQPSVLTLGLARSSALTGLDSNADGHQDAEHVLEAVVLSSSGTGGLLSLGTAQAVGSGEWTTRFEIPANTPLTLLDGKAVVGGLFSAGAGYTFSEVHVDSISLAYSRPYIAKEGDSYLTFSGPNRGEAGYEVTLPSRGLPIVFAYNNKGALVRLALESQSTSNSAGGGTQRLVQFAMLNGAKHALAPTTYWVSSTRGFLNVRGLTQKSISTKASLLAQAKGANYLLIAHPMFMGTVLSDYATVKNNQGYSTAVINYLDVVDTFGGGQPGPAGLTSYLVQANAQSTLEHVLLVGSSVYDHLDKQGTGAMTFIPGHYGQSNYSNFTVSDVPYITNPEGELFATIGRWPVRTLSDLNTIMSKSIAWNNADRSRANALLIAEHTVAGENIDFGTALDGVSHILPGSVNTTKVYVDAIMAADPGLRLAQALAQAKRQLIDHLNASPQLVLYNGHGTTSQLSNKGLFRAGDVSQITASGAEIWLPMSCYLTYYESTHINTLAHQLLFSGNAVTIAGATLLSNQQSNIAAGTAILDSTLNHDKSIGEAVNAHKSRQNNKSLNMNLSILGDPTLRM